MTTTYSTPVNEETATKPKAKKFIELVRYINTITHRDLSGVASFTFAIAANWDHIRLVIKGRNDEFDVIAVWDDDDPSSPTLYLGHWNDGVIG
jgi:hypothetical protein